jgi:hypothetical protein
MRRFFIVLAALAFCLPIESVLDRGHAQAEISPLLGIYNADNVSLYAGRKVYPSGRFQPMGVLNTISATAATAAGTAEQTLATYSLPANALDQAGRKLRIRTAWHAATNSNNKTVKLYFGASSISTGTLTTSNKNGWLELIVTKSGSSTQIVWGTGLVDTTAITPYLNASGSDTDTAAIVIKATGQDGTDSAGDITLHDFFVEYMN